MTGALALVRLGGRILLVFTRDRKHWELPGGSIEPGETPEACARREVAEESGQRVGLMVLRGWAVWFAPGMKSGGPECCAVYEGMVEKESPFAPTGEIERMAWDVPPGDPGTLAGIDRALIDLVLRPA